VRREITRRGGQKPCLRIVRGLFAALADRAGVIAHRPGALERVQLLLEDWQLTRDRLAETERRMTAVLDELGLTALATSMIGLSLVGAAAILAETGDPRRFVTRSRGGQARRPGPAGETVRRVHRSDPADRAGTSRAAPGGLARGLGSPVGCQNSAMGAELVFRRLVGFQNSALTLDLLLYAARSYSLMRPPRTARRLIRF
jgi:hypothetical protein